MNGDVIMSWKLSCHSSSSSASSSCAFYKGSRLLLSSITIITIVLLVLLPSPSSLFSFYVNANDFVVFASPSSVSQSETTTVPVSPPPPQTISSQSSQSQSQEKAGLSADNFDLSDGYIIEPFMSNLSMPTSIAVDSANGTLYVAESIEEYDNNNSNSSIMLSTSSSPVSFLSPQAQIRIVKDAIGGNNNSIVVNQTHDSSGGVINIDNNTTFINNALNWPVIDMEVDDASGLLYAFHDHTTISRINTTSGEREDIITTEEEGPYAGSDKYEEHQQHDPLSLLVNSSSQIALSGKEDYLDSRSADDEQGGGGNHDSYNSTVLYIPCMNGDVDNDYGTYCILGLPIDRSGNNAMVDNISSINSSA